MTRLHGVLSLSLVLSLSACAPLHPHESAWGDAGEVTLRVLACPLTFCMSEVGLWQQAEDAKRRPIVREAHSDDAALMGLGMALSGGGPFTPRPVAPLRQPACQSVVGAKVGPTAYLNCY